MKALVTGNLGFIGSHLTRALLDAGWEVVGIDNGCTGSEANLRRLDIPPGAVHQLGGLLDVADLDIGPGSLALDILRDVTVIFHLACPASPKMYAAHPRATFRALCQGTMVLAQLSQLTDSTLVLASTSEVYGDPDCHPQEESYRGAVNTLGPRSIYDEGKRLAEALLYHFASSWVVVRLFNTYGPNMAWDDGRLLPNLFAQGISGHPLTVYGDGSQTRSFCYVSDTVRGIVQAYASPLMLESQHEPWGVFNIGNDDERTVLSVAERIAEMYGVEIAREALPQDDPVRRRPDITLARECLGWQPRVAFDEGLQHTREYFERLAMELK